MDKLQTTIKSTPPFPTIPSKYTQVTHPSFRLLLFERFQTAKSNSLRIFPLTVRRVKRSFSCLVYGRTGMFQLISRIPLKRSLCVPPWKIRLLNQSKFMEQKCQSFVFLTASRSWFFWRSWLRNYWSDFCTRRFEFPSNVLGPIPSLQEKWTLLNRPWICWSLHNIPLTINNKLKQRPLHHL